MKVKTWFEVACNHEKDIKGKPKRRVKNFINIDRRVAKTCPVCKVHT